MSTFFWSDLHFDDLKVAAERGYADTGTHDNAIISAWMQTVTAADTVWLTGDLAFDDPTQALEILRWLPGTKHLVYGNHDTAHPMHANAAAERIRYEAVFETAAPSALITIGGQNTMLSHFPYASGKLRERHAVHRLEDNGMWLVHGHVHQEWRRRKQQINCGVDMWPDGPVSEQTLTAIMLSYELNSGRKAA